MTQTQRISHAQLLTSFPTATAPRPRRCSARPSATTCAGWPASSAASEVAGGRADRPPLDLPAVRRRHRRPGPRAARGRDRGPRPGRHLGAELRRVGAAAVRDREDRRDPGQHQPGLPQPRARLRAAPGRGPAAGQRGELQDQRLPRDDRRGARRPGRPGAGDLPRHRGVGRAADGRRSRRRRRAGRGARPSWPSTTRSTSSTPAGRPGSRRARRSRTTTSSTTGSSSARCAGTPSRTGSASRCRSTTASGWCSATWPR